MQFLLKVIIQMNKLLNRQDYLLRKNIPSAKAFLPLQPEKQKSSLASISLAQTKKKHLNGLQTDEEKRQVSGQAQKVLISSKAELGKKQQIPNYKSLLTAIQKQNKELRTILHQLNVQNQRKEETTNQRRQICHENIQIDKLRSKIKMTDLRASQLLDEQSSQNDQSSNFVNKTSFDRGILEQQIKNFRNTNSELVSELSRLREYSQKLQQQLEQLNSKIQTLTNSKLCSQEREKLIEVWETEKSAQIQKIVKLHQQQIQKKNQIIKNQQQQLIYQVSQNKLLKEYDDELLIKYSKLRDQFLQMRKLVVSVQMKLQEDEISTPFELSSECDEPQRKENSKPSQESVYYSLNNSQMNSSSNWKNTLYYTIKNSVQNSGSFHSNKVLSQQSKCQIEPSISEFSIRDYQMKNSH